EFVLWFGLRRQQKRIARKELVTLVILKRGTVKLVRAGAADQVHLAADHTAVFSRKDALDNLDLGYGFDAHDVDLILSPVLAHGPPFRIRVRLRTINRDSGSTSGDTIHPHGPGRS